MNIRIYDSISSLPKCDASVVVFLCGRGVAPRILKSIEDVCDLLADGAYVCWLDPQHSLLCKYLSARANQASQPEFNNVSLKSILPTHPVVSFELVHPVEKTAAPMRPPSKLLGFAGTLVIRAFGPVARQVAQMWATHPPQVSFAN